MRTSILVLAALAALSIAPPASAQVAATMCKDGTPSSTSGRGACSGHGGIDRARTKAADKAVKAEAKEVVQNAKASGTMVECGDGTMGTAGRGACARHKGVKIVQLPAAATPAATPAPMPAPRTPASAPVRATRPTPAVPATAPSATAQSAPAAASSRRAEDNDPTGALAQCKDGMYSHATNRRGACSRHKGVAKWM